MEIPEERRRATAERILQPVARREELLPWKPTLTCTKTHQVHLIEAAGKRERGCNHRWASSITIIYLEVRKCAAGVLRLQRRGSDMFPRTFHSIDWLLAAWSRRPLVCQPVTKQKSPPMSSSAAPVWGTRLAEPSAERVEFASARLSEEH